MNTFREVNDDILKDWLDFRDKTDFAFVNDENKKHTVKFKEVSEKFLNSVPKQNKKFVEKKLELLNSSFLNYIFYWNKKYYRNGFCDSVQLIIVYVDKKLKLIQSFFKILKNFGFLGIFLNL